MSKPTPKTYIIITLIILILLSAITLFYIINHATSESLSMPQNLKVVNNTLTFDEVEKAESYRIAINSEPEISINTAAFDLNRYATSGGNIKITVTATAKNRKDSIPVSYVYRIPGLYQTGTDTLNLPWKDLVSREIINISSGILSVNSSAKEALCGDLVLDGSVMIIGASAFNGCDKLSSVIIQRSTHVIDAYAFANCSGITSLTLPDSVTIINDSAFFGCASLKEVVIPEGITKIGDMAFAECTGIEKIELPRTLEIIGKQAFAGNPKLTKVEIPDRITEIGDDAFADCAGMEELEIGKNNRKYSSCDGVCYSKDFSTLIFCPAGKQNVIFAEGVHTIAAKAFANCRNIAEIVIPVGVTAIEDSAFSGCSALTTLILPDSLVHIGSRAFSECTALRALYIPGSVLTISAMPTQSYSPFYNCSTELELYYPGYEEQEGWDEYWNWCTKDETLEVHCGRERADALHVK